MSFALRAGDADNVLLFCLAASMTAVLVILERAALFTIARFGELGESRRDRR